MRPLRAVTLAVLVCLLFFAAGNANAETIFADNFNGYSGNQNANQPGTGLLLSFGGVLPGWNREGFNAVHAVDLGGLNYAPSFYKDNAITLAAGVAANNLGVQYLVALDAGPSVYADLPQATLANDGLIVSVLRGNNTVLASATILPGAWVAGPSAQALAGYSFTYLGDGSGDVRFRISTNNSGMDRFGGAIDNFSVSAVPEPASLALWSLVGTAGLAAWRRKRKAIAE